MEARSGTGVEMASSSCCKYGCEDSELPDVAKAYGGGVEGRVSWVTCQYRGRRGGHEAGRVITLGEFVGGMGP